MARIQTEIDKKMLDIVHKNTHRIGEDVDGYNRKLQKID